MKSICCSCTGLGLALSLTPAGLQLPITLAPGDLMPSPASPVGILHVIRLEMQAHTQVHTINFKWKGPSNHGAGRGGTLPSSLHSRGWDSRIMSLACMERLLLKGGKSVNNDMSEGSLKITIICSGYICACLNTMHGGNRCELTTVCSRLLRFVS